MNERTIWDFLIKKTNNPYGTAAIMGNLMAESSLDPKKTTGIKSGASTYIEDADAGRIDFVHDGVAFGIVQWLYHSRKQGLLDYAKSQNASVGYLGVQLEYMWQELQSYKTVLNAVKTAKNVREASDIFMLRYEKPANTSDSAKLRRAGYGETYLKQFTSLSHGDVQTESNKKKVVARVNVNIRSGDSTSFSLVGSIKAGDSLEWVATAENGWHAVRYKKKVCWVSGEFTKLQ